MAIGAACNSPGSVDLSSNDSTNVVGEALFGETLFVDSLHRHKYDDILRQLRRTAATGNPTSEELLGVLLLGGPSALRFSGAYGQNTCEALAWFDRAATHGSQVGNAYRNLMGQAELTFARKHCLIF